MKDKDYYAILEVSPDASPKEIKRSYRRLARLYHPDLHPGDKFDEDMFKAVNEAYEVLSDPDKKWAYDRFQEERSINNEFYRSPQADVPTAQEDNKQIKKMPGMILSWIRQLGFGWFILAAILLIIILPPAFICAPVLFPPERDVDCLQVDDATFQKEVLESLTPVLVVFCWNPDEWTETQAGITSEGPAPRIVAVKRIIKGREFEASIKFCKYYREPTNDPLVAEYGIRYWPTTILFKDGSIFWKDSYWYAVDSMKEDIEASLRKAIGE